MTYGLLEFSQANGREPRKLSKRPALIIAGRRAAATLGRSEALYDAMIILLGLAPIALVGLAALL
ncbi:hypothetical protein JQ615_14695 [Bradyrhizobium jicamae]|uniref:Uncharacterized protein n=1 Tax=Bradyrhizobium jicamae TaxID=280332 RepID=A0ABS5FIL7_9BRAD|nr:hypothetical protein [Bradyrhizobium jicamae]MBR0796641.1 hypothetical protein [Bradyrhizobium jicamae]MBR0934961.1 hypothetical protein [Bradyrhizobium jicamae]